MKIAILVKNYLPNLGGTELAAYNIAIHLAQRHHDVHLMTGEEFTTTSIQKDNGDFLVYRLAFPQVPLIGISILWLKMVLTLRKIHPDLTHVQDISMSVPAFVTKKLFGIPYVVMTQGSDIYHPDTFDRLIRKTVLKNASGVIALTKDMKKRLQQVVDRDITVIPNGVDITPFQEMKRSSHQMQKSLIFVGRIEQVKGIEYLLQAMVTVIQKYPQVRLVILGTGEDEARIQALAAILPLEKSVEFVGSVPHEEVPRYMADSDIFVLPSLSEGFPLVIVEAMAAGLPILATNVGGLKEVVQDRMNGFLVDPQNAGALADKLLFMLQNPVILDEMSRNNIQAATGYGWDHIIVRIEEVYQKKVSSE
jgi:glycosyltransferase involved in cell wall biosynthesis